MHPLRHAHAHTYIPSCSKVVVSEYQSVHPGFDIKSVYLYAQVCWLTSSDRFINADRSIDAHICGRVAVLLQVLIKRCITGRHWGFCRCFIKKNTSVKHTFTRLMVIWKKASLIKITRSLIYGEMQHRASRKTNIPWHCLFPYNWKNIFITTKTISSIHSGFYFDKLKRYPPFFLISVDNLNGFRGVGQRFRRTIA